MVWKESGELLSCIEERRHKVYGSWQKNCHLHFWNPILQIQFFAHHHFLSTHLGWQWNGFSQFGNMFLLLFYFWKIKNIFSKGLIDSMQYWEHIFCQLYFPQQVFFHLFREALLSSTPTGNVTTEYVCKLDIRCSIEMLSSALYTFMKCLTNFTTNKRRVI